MNKIWFPNQRVIRTVVQVITGTAAAIGLFLIIAPQILEAIREFLPETWYLWLLGFVAVIGSVSAALSKIMSIPQVDAWLQKWGAGSAPADAVVVEDADSGELTGMTRQQYRAFKGE